MKKLKRTAPAIDYVKLFADFSSLRAITEWGEDAISAFGSEVAGALRHSVAAPHRIRGIRAEALFEMVVASLGTVQFMKAEDQGDIYFKGDDIAAPDFMIVAEDQTRMLVEVKCIKIQESKETGLSISDSYMRRLIRYAKVTNADLWVAVLWEELEAWTLSHIDVFEKGISGEKKWSLSMSQAMGHNEMHKIGDRMIGTYSPLRFRLRFDPNKSEPFTQEGKPFDATIAGVDVLVGSKVLSGRAKAIAIKIIFFGAWQEIDQELHREGDQLVALDHLYAPNAESASDEIELVGFLSQFISRVYLSGAENTVHSVAEDETLEPGKGNFIPKDFMSLDLPLALVTVLPKGSEK